MRRENDIAAPGSGHGGNVADRATSDRQSAFIVGGEADRLFAQDHRMVPGPSYAFAMANNNVCYIRWHVAAKIPGCLGFSIHRVAPSGQETALDWEGPLPAWMGFKGDTHADSVPRTTDAWPVQKFEWRDLSPPRGVSFSYRIIPMVGTPGSLVPKLSLALDTAAVSLNGDFGPLSVSFTRGILAAQETEGRAPSGRSAVQRGEKLGPAIHKPGHPLRDTLAADSLPIFTSFLARAAGGGRILAAIHALTDRELISHLVQLGDKLDLVLSNADASEWYVGEDGRRHTRRVYDRINREIRRKLGRQSLVKLTSRLLGVGAVSHNNFLIYVDADDHPQAVLAGSASWTPLSLCAQTNNILVIESPGVARLYHEYWKRVKEDAGSGTSPRRAGGALVSGVQRAALRSWNAQPLFPIPVGEGDIKVWFSPNVSGMRAASRAAERPPDLEEVLRMISEARQSILFLVFAPSEPSIAQHIREVHRQRIKSGGRLFVAGAASDPVGGGQFVEVFQRGTGHIVQGPARAGVFGMGWVSDAFGRWNEEVYQLGQDVIHDCMVVIDHWDAQNCAVITGSHNLNHKCSSSDDANLVIIRGNRDVALAYATHVLDVADHFRWRWRLQQDAKGPASKRGSVWRGLKNTDEWQNKYFDAADPASHDSALLRPLEQSVFEERSRI